MSNFAFLPVEFRDVADPAIWAKQIKWTSAPSYLRKPSKELLSSRHSSGIGSNWHTDQRREPHLHSPILVDSSRESESVNVIRYIPLADEPMAKTLKPVHPG